MNNMESPKMSGENLNLNVTILEEENKEENKGEENGEENKGEENKEENSLPDGQVQKEEGWKGSLQEEEVCVEEAGTGSKHVSVTGEGETRSGEESTASDGTPRTKRAMSYPDRVRILNLRRNLNQLDSLAKDKEALFQKNREELKACHSRIEVLTTQQQNTVKEMESEEEAGNTAAVFRLRAMHRRLCDELGNEKDLESNLELMLSENMLDMWKIEIEQGNFEALRKEIMQDEKELEAQCKKQAEVRLQKKRRRSVQLGWQWLASERKIQEENEEYEGKIVQALGEVQRNRKKAIQFLKASMASVCEREVKEDEKLQEQTQRRMETVLSLKNNIAANRESLRLSHALRNVKVLEAKQEHEKIKEAIKAEGHNVTREICILQRQEEFERQKKEFLEQQKAGKLEIVARILKEEAQVEKIKKQSCPPRLKHRDKLSDSARWRRKTWQYIEKACADSEAPVAQKSRRTPSPCSSLDTKGRSMEELLSPSKASQWVSPQSQSEDEEDGTLAQPEFTGIWDQEYDVSKVPDDTTDSKPLGATKLDKEIFAQNLVKLRRGFVHRHRVSGREYKGCPFYSKPSLIHFKDFDIGKTYKKKMILINAFYSINYCRLDGVSEHLKDFFTVDFDPPGPMSAGMACEVGVTFKPMINEDLEGEIAFLSQIGSFSIPLKCSTKKCVLALDKELIDFGTYVVGETISRTITLTNCGALGTRFWLRRSANTNVTQAVSTLPSPGSRAIWDPVDEKVFNLKSGRRRSSGPFFLEKETMSLTRFEEVIQLTPPAHTDQLGQPASEVDVTGEKTSPSLPASPQECQSKEEVAEINLGKVTEGDIGPFSSVKLQVIFTPTIPGDVHADFEFVFENRDCKPLRFSAVAVSVALPVWVTNPDVDLKICMYDRLYQDCIVIQSRATSALRLEFPVCKELSRHMELLPKTGYIQSHSSFSVQLKFLPSLAVFNKETPFSRFRQTLPRDARKYFDKETRVLQVPMTIIVSDQSKPVRFTVHAIVTTSDIEISPAELNFGYCSIYEAVRTTVTLTNKAILPQEFGFIKHPEFVEVQPGDGFGVLLPLESLVLDVIFHAKKAKEYSFELTCKTEINREFKLSCKAIGVRPPLELSHSLVQFSATALNDVSMATFLVINSHVSLNQITHVVPKIGEGEPPPVGPTSFQFLVPEDSPLTFLPCVGTVLPGKKCMVRVSFRPVLCDQLIRMEAWHLLRQAAEAKALAEKKALELEQQTVEPSPRVSSSQKRKEEVRKDGKKPSSSSYITQPSRDRSSKLLSKVSEQPNPEDIRPDSEEYITAHLSLIRSFNDRFERYVIPCLVASGRIDEKTGPEIQQYSPYNTLYLELHCPAVKPSVMVTSNSGKSVFEFGDVAVGHRVQVHVQMQNISQEELTLGYSLLNPYGPFLLVNPLKRVEKGASMTLVISFTPDEANRYFEKLEVRTEEATLTLTLIGQGVVPSIACSVEGDVLHMGYVVTKETATTTFKASPGHPVDVDQGCYLGGLGHTGAAQFNPQPLCGCPWVGSAMRAPGSLLQIENTSTIPLKFSMLLDSLSPYKERVKQKLPSFLTSQGQADLVGTQNYSGLSVFSVSPVESTVLPGKFQEFTVTFSPDHESLYYSDLLKVVLFDTEVIRVIQLKGAARNHIMYVEGGDRLDVPVESLAITASIAEEAAKAESDKTAKSVLLSLVSVQSETFVIPAVRELKVGGIRSTQLASKKNIEFNWESLQLLQLKGFTVDPVKGAVERGQTKTISISWVPPAGSDPNQPVTGTATLIVKGDVKEVYGVYFMGRIVAK
ncbi:hypothetical protein lerEdw1_019743 [Lerista edwardsae]|nr:hypothetical protein lerEdw1_019743 [Lerista edwardsae]